MKMRMYNPQLAELLGTLENPPKVSTFKTFGEIVDAMRTTRAFLKVGKDKFKEIRADAIKGGKLTKSGLDDLQADFNDAFNPLYDFMRTGLLKEIDNWKERELKNAFAIVNKAPTDDQVRKLEVILKRDGILQSEVEMWAKEFGDNYLCASAFRDYAKRMGYILIFSDFTDADERIQVINEAYNYLTEMLSVINSEESSYKLLAFYGTNENGESYDGSAAKTYTEILDADPTFKPQKITVKPITDEDDKKDETQAS